MDKDLLAILGFVAMFVLMALRVPIGIAMGAVGVAGYALASGLTPALRQISTTTFSTIIDFNFSVIPMFVLMGAFASAGGMSQELFRAGNAWLGHLRGGTALATIAACGGFAAINGSSVATAATMTQVAMPELERENYHRGFAAGMIAAGGTLGIMIPPSTVFVLYGIMTDVDIGDLFLAGIVPGVLGILMYMAVIRVVAWKRPDMIPLGHKHSWSERFTTLRDIWATLLLFVFVIGGMNFGLFTPTEGAGMGAVGAFVISLLRGRLTIASTIDALVASMRTIATVFTIAIGAFLFGYFLTITGTTQKLVEWLVTLPIGPYGVLTFILLFYLLLGAIMDELAMILLTVPIIYPAMMKLGFDPIWFGVIIVMAVTLGMIMPPVGMNVFVINSIRRDIGIGAIYSGVSPFIVSDLIRLFILAAIPTLSTWLPKLIH
jgi:tripartite ATP-independent transporter DctM subunit